MHTFHRTVSIAAVAIATIIVAPTTGVASDEPASTPVTSPPFAGVVFAPGTPASTVDTVLARHSAPDLEFQRFDRHWSAGSTALDNGGSSQGDSIELTWSIVPDGTPMRGAAGEPNCNSILIAELDTAFGAGQWQAEIQRVWDDWTGLSGNVYTPAVALDSNGTPIDDGAGWPDASGVEDVRGDIRIGGCAIDGNSGILAYNFFPSNGDMKIDAPDSFYDNTSLSPGFHNLFSHEHGHGAGAEHVCPRDGTKLLEPIINLGFTGLQHDDIRAVQRGYGDRFELIDAPNDSAPLATPLDPSTPVSETKLSLDSTSDEDWFSFSAMAGSTIDLSISPNGFVYDEAADNENLCQGVVATEIDSSALQDLSFEIRDSSGVLTTVDATSAGSAESISGFAMPSTGTFYVRVVSEGGADDTQLYDLAISRADPSAATTDFGDAPSPFPTLLEDDGARHLGGGASLGSAIDFEFDGTASSSATGDDLFGIDDEDGVTLSGPVVAGQLASFDVDVSQPTLLDAWVDWNGNGSWSDSGERVASSRVLVTGANDLTVLVPAGAAHGPVHARFRVSSAGGLSFTGSAADGEVEDLLIDVGTVPDAPTDVVATAGDGEVLVAWDAPADVGSSPITSYVARATPGGATCTTDSATSCTVDGLDNGTSYVFRVTASNAAGESAASDPSLPATPSADVRPPGTPTITSVTAGDGEVDVEWTPPADDGGSPITAYVATASPGGAACSTDGSLSCDVEGLANGTTYQFSVTAENIAGRGEGSTPSDPIQPIDSSDPDPDPTAASATVSTTPERFADTRPAGATIDDRFEAEGRRARSSTYQIEIAGRGDVPHDASAVVANVTAIQADTIGFVTVFPCDVAQPTSSSLNYASGVNRGNEIVAPLSASGEICVFTSASIHLTVDVVGFVPSGSALQPLTPRRYLDTRPGGSTFDDAAQGGERPGSDTTVRLQIAARGEVPASAVAVIVNVTAISPDGTGFVSVHPCLRPTPNTASLNYTRSVNVANELIASVDESGDICLTTSAGTHLAADVAGYLLPGSSIETTGPSRLLDTRPAGRTIDGLHEAGSRPFAGSELRIQVGGRDDVPNDATAAVLYVTAVQPDIAGFVTVHACGTRPDTASLNFVAGVNVGNEIVTELSPDGQVCLFSSAGTHLTADVVAYAT